MTQPTANNDVGIAVATAPPLEDAIGRIDTEVAELAATVDRFIGRLAPVTAPSAPSPGGATPALVEGRPVGVVVATLRDEASRIARVTRDLREAMDLLEV